MDDLGRATGMNRPSLYNAFGSKHKLYVAALDHYREMGRSAMRTSLSDDLPFAEALHRTYRKAISIYLSSARGCFLIGTAATESVRDATIRRQFADGLHELDDLMEERMRKALDRGELESRIAPKELAQIACGIMNALALRARAGDRRAVLEAMADAGVRLICGAR